MDTPPSAQTVKDRSHNPMRMTTHEFQIRFLTPAFLGDAEQNGRWRTPPFKAQLRQWWRMVWAADHGYSINLADMRREEGLLFGNAWLDNDFRKSLVRLRLGQWDEGKLKKQQWPADTVVTHPEVKNHQGQIKPVGSALYLGYGPLEFQGGTKLKKNAAIQAEESAVLSLAFPTTHGATELKVVVEENVPRLEHALWLMHHYGTVGGRSRNGWGSFTLTPCPSPRGRGAGGEGQLPPLRNWKDCLNLDWPHAIGKDEKGPLIWLTKPHNDWKSLMRTLAIIKIGLRTQFVFPPEQPPHPRIEPRHWLSYPITTHTTRAWDRGARLPNPLRFKVRATESGELVGVIFHIPHLPPTAFGPNRLAIQSVWQQVHDLLDHLCADSPRTYPTIPDNPPARRRSALKPQLDTVTLKRIQE